MSHLLTCFHNFSVDVHALETDGALHSIAFTLYDVQNPSDPREVTSGIQLINETEQVSNYES